MDNALRSAIERARNALVDVKKRPKNAMVDALRGGLLGATTDAVGYLPDAVADFMRPFGYNVAPQDVVGGTEWLANRVSTPTNSLAENTGRFLTGMLTPSVMDFARMGKGPMQELTVYHGSPHRINNVDEANPMGRFDISKVGTGEGAQAYGHGLYLAENPNVARQYAENLQNVSVDGRVLDMDSVSQSGFNNNNQTAYAAKEIAEKGYDRVLAEAKQSAAENAESPWAAQWLEEVESLAGKQTAVNKYFYTVDLPDEHVAKMLDWDKPLSEQPESVRKLLGDVDPNGRINFGLAYERWRKATGLSGEAASNELKKLGFPGIKYLDGGSRPRNVVDARLISLWEANGKNAEAAVDQFMRGVYNTPAKKAAMRDQFLKQLQDYKGTSNFVIFDGDTAKILKRE